MKVIKANPASTVWNGQNYKKVEITVRDDVGRLRRVDVSARATVEEYSADAPMIDKNGVVNDPIASHPNAYDYNAAEGFVGHDIDFVYTDAGKVCTVIVHNL